jgi:hypothetical protein
MNPTRKNRTSRAVKKLSSQAEQAAAHAPDPLADLSRATKIAMQGETDPYVMLGVLVEGMVQTLVTRIPPERHGSTLAAAMVTLRERLADRGVAPGESDRCYQQPSCN